MEANIQLHPGKTLAECENLCDARGMECKGFEFGVAHGVTFPAEKLCSGPAADCDYSGCNDKPCTSPDWCPAFPVHTFGCVYWAVQGGGGGLKCMYGGKKDYPAWKTCPYPGSDFQPGDCRLKSSANMSDCNGKAFNGDFYAKVSTALTSSNPTTTPAPTTSSTTTTTTLASTSSSTSAPSTTTPAPVEECDLCYSSSGCKLPCSYGGCIFDKTAGTNALERRGSCSGHTANLFLDNRGIASVPTGVFDDIATR